MLDDPGFDPLTFVITLRVFRFYLVRQLQEEANKCRADYERRHLVLHQTRLKYEELCRKGSPTTWQFKIFVYYRLVSAQSRAVDFSHFYNLLVSRRDYNIWTIVTVGRPGNKLEEVKAKYTRSETKVHNLHNAYIIALCELNQFHQHHACITLPALLNYQQCVQEKLVQQWSVCIVNRQPGNIFRYIYDNVYNRSAIGRCFRGVCSGRR